MKRYQHRQWWFGRDWRYVNAYWHHWRGCPHYDWHKTWRYA